MSFRFATQTVQMSMQYIQYEIIIAIKKRLHFRPQARGKTGLIRQSISK